QLAPAAAAVDAHRAAAFRLGVAFEPIEQVQPLPAVVAAAGDDGAELLAVGAGDFGDRRRLDALALPGEPEERRAAAHRMLDLGIVGEPSLLHRCLDERSDVRPHLMRIGGRNRDEATLALLGAA